MPVDGDSTEMTGTMDTQVTTHSLNAVGSSCICLRIICMAGSAKICCKKYTFELHTLLSIQVELHNYCIVQNSGKGKLG